MSGNIMARISYLDGWRLFGLTSLLITTLILIAMAGRDLSSTDGLLYMIRYSVRCALPWFVLAFVASSLHRLRGSSSSLWLLQNRRYLGLCFAYGMAWQLLFIMLLMTTQSTYFFAFASWFQVFETAVYVVLLVMVLTSFSIFNSYVSRRTWRIIHKSGMYLLWFIITGTYAIYFAIKPSLFYVLLLVIFFAAMCIRVLAVFHRRRDACETSAS